MPTISAALAIALEHHQAGRLDLAEEIYRRILAVEPEQNEALHRLGLAAHQTGRLAEALEHYQRAVELCPSTALYRNSLANLLMHLGRPEEAIAGFRRAVELEPSYMQVYNNLGVAYLNQGQVDEAVACFQRALELDPGYVGAQCNLGVAWRELGETARAIECYLRALELDPTHAAAFDNLLYALHFSEQHGPEAILQAHRQWNRLYAEPLKPSIQPHANERSAERRLRVGYVSPDFRRHPVGRFLLPLLEAHDRGRFEVFGYSSVLRGDALTDLIRGRCDVWRDVPALSDERLAQVIREDRIDILVDLTMHMSGSRLLTFARKPAPVQVTYLAYSSTTGLDAMDYRLTDPHLDPPGAERFYCEKSVALPATYWCYRPPQETPAVGRRPALEAGHVTFGCLNNFSKISEAAFSAWCRLLAALPGSRLILHAAQGSHRQRALEGFARQGIAAERVGFSPRLPEHEYMAVYHGIDIALDPFPYAGGTTTCDALWMGVPVVSLAGRTAVGRAGVSILSNVGLGDLLARDVDEYVGIAARLAGDVPRLGDLRASLRRRVEQSPLMDAPGFARAVEAAYGRMWRAWCAGQAGAASPPPRS